MSNQHTTRIAARLAPAAGITATTLILVSLVVGRGENIDTVLYRVGVALAMLAATMVVLGRTHATDHQLEIVRQAAYDAGYTDGCEVSPIVAFPRPSAVPPLPGVTGDGAAQQLGDQRNVGQGA